MRRKARDFFRQLKTGCNDLIKGLKVPCTIRVHLRPAPWHHASGSTCLSLRRLLHLEVPSAKERDDPVLLDQFPIPPRMAIVPLPFLTIFACDYRVFPYLMLLSCPRFVVQPSPMGRRNAVPAGERGEQGSAIHRLMLSIDLYCRFV